jgi:hypothetical protein
MRLAKILAALSMIKCSDEQDAMQHVIPRTGFFSGRTRLLRLQPCKPSSIQQDNPQEYQFLIELKKNLADLKHCYAELSDAWEFERFDFRDGVEKDLTWVQGRVSHIASLLEQLSPLGKLHPFLQRIVDEAAQSDLITCAIESRFNNERTVLKAFFQLTYFLRLAIDFGQRLHVPPDKPDFEWCSLLFICSIR